MNYPNYAAMIEVTRGPIVESVHFGAAAVVDPNGRLVASFGDPATVTYLRSSAKPLQLLPFMELGGAEAFGLSDRQVAVMCASHSGTDDHVAVIRSIQEKIGVTEQNLMCGVHAPGDEKTAIALIKRGEEPSPLRHNCSGKHTGMLAQAVLRHLPVEDYINPRHQVQTLILQTFAEMCGVTVADMPLGTDGCSAPVFAVSLRSAALGYARLCNPDRLATNRAAACRRITRSMTSNPDMIAGPGRFDTLLMAACGGKIITKSGAEGYQAIGLLPGALGPGSPALGITIKISDGDETSRARTLASIEILRQLGALNPAELQALAQFDVRPVYNWRKLEVGEIRPCFKLEM
jgi:L-asparaginase II